MSDRREGQARAHALRDLATRGLWAELAEAWSETPAAQREVVDLGGISLAGAQLEFTRLSKLRAEGGDFRGAHLAGSQLLRARLHGAIFTGADLRGAFIGSVDLSAADLTDAILDKASLEDVNLAGARLDRASLCGLKIEPGSVSFSNASLRGATYDRETQWPNGFDPQSAGAIPISDPV